MSIINVLDWKPHDKPLKPWDGQRRLRFMFIRTSSHDYTTAYSHELLDEMEATGLLAGIDWNYDPGPHGPLVETREHLVQVGGGVLERVRAASQSGQFDAIVIQGFLDPVLYPAREVSAVPVLGCGNSALHIASLLGHRTCIVDTLECMAIMIRENCRLYELDHKVASVRSIEYPVREIMRKERVTELVAAMEKQIRAAVEQDGADTIILGCTALTWLAPHLRARFENTALGIVPIIEPIHAAVSLARSLVSMRLNHSRLAYPGNAPKPAAFPR